MAQNSYEIFSPPITLTLNTCLSGVIYPIRFERWLKKIIFVLKEAKDLGETFICICLMAFFGMPLLSVDNCSLILEKHQLCKTIPTSVDYTENHQRKDTYVYLFALIYTIAL